MRAVKFGKYLPDKYQIYVEPDGGIDVDLVDMLYPGFKGLVDKTLEDIISADFKNRFTLNIELSSCKTQQEVVLAKTKYNSRNPKGNQQECENAKYI